MTAARTSGADNRNCLLDCHSAVLENVLSGNFPRRDICKMNSTRLKVFVGHLEHLTRVIATSLGNENFQTLSWCCSVVGDLKTAKNGVLREQMIQLILNSCNFFRELKLKHPRSPNLNLNDENFDITKISPIEIKSDTISGNIDFKIDSFKRKLDCTSVIEEDNEIKRRRTLRSVSKPVISVNVNKQSLSSLKQSHFLGVLGLTLNNNYEPKKTVLQNTSRSIKLFNCPQVPLSSDLGRTIMKREQYFVPNYMFDRKLERLEWYVNKDIQKVIDQRYEVSYVPGKREFSRNYHYPVRQFHQLRGDIGKTNFLLQMCKPIRVVAVNKDLIALKKSLDSFIVNVRLERLTGDVLLKHICKDLRIVLRPNRQVERHCNRWLKRKSR